MYAFVILDLSLGDKDALDFAAGRMDSLLHILMIPRTFFIQSKSQSISVYPSNMTTHSSASASRYLLLKDHLAAVEDSRPGPSVKIQC